MESGRRELRSPARPRQPRAGLRLPAEQPAGARASRCSSGCASTARFPTRRCWAWVGRTRPKASSRRALTPWMALRDRNLLDSAVQEAYLAIPYAFAKLNANAQAAENYELAIRSFDTETVNLDASIAGDQRWHDARQTAEARRARITTAGSGSCAKCRTRAQSRYLYHLLAGHDFQEGLKNYRDLAFLGGTLARWQDSIVAFDDMLATRERAYAEARAAGRRGARDRAASTSTAPIAPPPGGQLDQSRPRRTSRRSARPRNATSGRASCGSSRRCSPRRTTTRPMSSAKDPARQGRALLASRRSASRRACGTSAAR